MRSWFMAEKARNNWMWKLILSYWIKEKNQEEQSKLPKGNIWATHYTIKEEKTLLTRKRVCNFSRESWIVGILEGQNNKEMKKK